MNATHTPVDRASIALIFARATVSFAQMGVAVTRAGTPERRRAVQALSNAEREVRSLERKAMRREARSTT